MNKNLFLPYGRQMIEDDDISAVVDVLKGDWLTTGPAVQNFEQAFCTATRALHTVACSSGTAALHLAYEAIGLNPGDVAIIPSVTFLATANAARYLGAQILFSDVDPLNGLMRPCDLKEAIKRAGDRRVKLIVPVHLGGQCENLAEIVKIAEDRSIVEDACHALGAQYGIENSFVGACEHSHASVFSFHPVKTIAMGEGGAVTTNNAETASRMQQMRNHGMNTGDHPFENTENAYNSSGTINPWYYETQALGYNYRASDIHCALGQSQLSKLSRFVEKRRAIASCYDRALTALAPHVRPVSRTPNCQPGLHLYQVLIDFNTLSIDRSALMEELKKRGIGSQVHYIPLHLQPYFSEQYGIQSFPGAEAFYRQTLSLPLFPMMDETDVTHVVTALADIIGLFN
jgi:UDP-4-amino-4,6-dideoxy-N-acetyl-beta-L-altrosamine transaminase